MIKVVIKTPCRDELVRAAMVEVAKGVTAKARRAAAPHGGVTVRVDWNPNGTIGKIDLQGSDHAIEAARASLNSELRDARAADMRRPRLVSATLRATGKEPSSPEE